MTSQETAAILGVIIKAYPGSRINIDRETVSLWAEMLQDLSAAEVTLAVKGMVATLKYPPSIADVREAVVKQRNAGDLSAGEAWGKVIKAVGRFGYNHPDEAHERLGDRIWAAIEQVGGWTNVCLSDSGLEVLSAQFERRYDAAEKQRRYREQVPDTIQQSFAQLVNNIKLLEGE